MLKHKADNRPVPKQLKKKVANSRPKIDRGPREQPRAKASREDSDKEVVVNLKIALPKIKLPDLRKAYTTHRRRIFIVSGALVGVIVVFGGFRLIVGRNQTPDSAKPETAQEQAEAAFNPLIPLANLKDAAGEQTKPEFKYDSEKKVLAYVTKYNTASLTISQQVVPDKFKTDPAQLFSLAQSMSATKTLETQKGAAYVATDEKTNAQTAVFVTDEVLVFLKTDKKLDDDEWKFYINQLNPSK